MRAHIHIKIADEGWILEKCASEIAKRASNVTYSVKEEPTANLQYYVNYSAKGTRVSRIEVAYFAHSEPNPEARNKYFSVAKDVDYRICHSHRYADELREHGFDDVTVISPGVDLTLFRPKVRVGVVGRTYHTGRKGEALVAAVLDVPGIEWRFTGAGWPVPSQRLGDKSLPDFYNDLDYVLIPSLYEGGPMSLVEGLACGIPVISSDVGWADKFPHIPFENGNPESLRCVLEDLVKKREELRHTVLNTTWDIWAEQHLELFDKLLGKLSKPSHAKLDSLSESSRKIKIVSHGTEGISKGGPTSRIANIVSFAASKGVAIESANRQLIAQKSSGPSIVHVFNSWPLRSALAELSAAKADGHTIVYSPIALNLSHFQYYHNAIPDLLSSAKNSHQLEDGIATIRSLTTHRVLNDRIPLEGVKGHFAALREGVDLADHVIFLSEYERNFMEAVGAKPKSAELIYNGVDAKTMANGDPELFHSQFGIRDFILMVGRIETRKNQALVAFALRHVKVPIVCIGHIGNEDYFQLLQRWRGENFIHIDRLDDRQLLASAYKAARCLIMSSWCEGAPLVALEAAAAGTPLILSNMSSEREYFGSFAKYVHPCDIQGLRDAVHDSLNNPENINDRAARSEMALSRFDIGPHASKTLATYERLFSDDRDRSVAANKIVLESSHLTHQLANRGILTGVTGVENNLSKAIVCERPNIESVVWTSEGYVATDFKKIGNLESALRIVTNINSSSSGHFLLSDVTVQVPRRSPYRPVEKVFSKFRQATTAFRQGVFGVARNQPPWKQRGSGAALQRFSVAIRPRFERINESGANCLGFGDRLLMLGQPWISNDRMLDALCELVVSKGLKLWPLIHDIIYVTDPDSFNLESRIAFRRRLTRLLSVSDTVIVSSKQVEQDLQNFIELSNCRPKISRIPMGVCRELIATKPIRPRQMLPERFVLYVSSMNERKRHNFIAEVWADVRRSSKMDNLDVALLFVGNPQAGFERFSDPSFRASLQENNIFVLDGIANAELAWLYKNCLFSVYPPRSEGWGLPPLESLYFGRPCVVSDSVPSARECDCPALVKVATGDYYAWVEVCSTLLTNERVREGLAAHTASFKLQGWEGAALTLVS